MKNINRFVLVTTLCALPLFAVSAYAEKGAERLVGLAKTSKAPAVAISSTIVQHPCPSCANILVTVVDRSTKGPNHPVSKVARHTCASCETKITTAGVGKAKHDVALHSCNGDTKPLCCASN